MEKVRIIHTFSNIDTSYPIHGQKNYSLVGMETVRIIHTSFSSWHEQHVVIYLANPNKILH